MKIIISNSDSTPIYEQIVKQIKSLILSEELVSGDSLPSMRTLASDLRISIITTKRAYEELEREGYIESYAGKGSFVKPRSKDFLYEQNLKEIERCLSQAVDIAKKSTVSLADLTNILEIIYKD